MSTDKKPQELLKTDDQGRITCLICGEESAFFDSVSSHLFSKHGVRPAQYREMFRDPETDWVPPIFSERKLAEIKRLPDENQEALKPLIDKTEAKVDGNIDGVIRNEEEKKEWASSREAVQQLRKRYDKTNPERVKQTLDKLLAGKNDITVRSKATMNPETKAKMAESAIRNNYATRPTHFITAAIPGRCNVKCPLKSRCEFLDPRDRLATSASSNGNLPNVRRFQEIRNNAEDQENQQQQYVRLGDVCPMQREEAERLIENYVEHFDVDLDDPTKMTMINILVSLTIQYARASRYLSAGETIWLGDKITESVGKDGTLMRQTLEKVLHPVTQYQDMLIKQIKSISNELMLTPMSQKTEKIQISTDFSAVMAETKSKMVNQAEAVDADFEEVTSESSKE